MSEKNFASYGDMETLVTEIASKCGPYTEITYEDWLQLTPYQQEHGRWDVTGVPGADGTISIDLMTKLWENPSPSAEFAAGHILLDLSDYQFVMVISYGGKCPPTLCGVGGSSQLQTVGRASATATQYGTRSIWREFYTNSTQVVFGDANIIFTTVASYVINRELIPYQIYGIKLHHTVEIKAIAPSVSTLAKNSVFDPTGTGLESTNAEDAIKELEANFQDGVDAVYDAVVAKGSTPASKSLSDVVQGIENIETGITPTGTIDITSNGTKDVTNYASANVNVPNSNSGTYTASSRSAALDMGATNTYRYVNTNSVPNSNSTTYTATTRSTKIDLGATNTYRYLVTSGVPNSNSGTFTATSRSTAIDMGAANTYRYVNTSGVKQTATFTASTRAASVDMGATNSYRYVNTNGVPNSNSTTYTYGSGSTGGTVNMGATNTYRYVNASNVYSKGVSVGRSLSSQTQTLSVYVYSNSSQTGTGTATFTFATKVVGVTSISFTGGTYLDFAHLTAISISGKNVSMSFVGNTSSSHGDTWTFSVTAVGY